MGPTGPTGDTGAQGETGPTGPEYTLTPAAAIGTLAAGATLADVIETLNALIVSLRNAGFLAT